MTDINMRPQRPASARPSTRRKRPCTAPQSRPNTCSKEGMQPWWMTCDDAGDEVDAPTVPVVRHVGLSQTLKEEEEGEEEEGEGNMACKQLPEPYIGVVIRETLKPISNEDEFPSENNRSPAIDTIQNTKTLSTALQYKSLVQDEPLLRFAATAEERAPILPPNRSIRATGSVQGSELVLVDVNSDHRLEQSNYSNKHVINQSEGTIAFPYSSKLGQGFCKVRGLRQNIALQSAVLAFKHRVKHPKGKPSYEMKRERLKTLNEQTPAHRTKVLEPFLRAESVQMQPNGKSVSKPDNQNDDNNSFLEEDRNTLAFGWDTISMNQSGGSAVVWDNVAKHLDMSVLLQEVYSAKPIELPHDDSTRKVLSLLKTLGDVIEDDLVAGALEVTGQILTSAVYTTDDSGEAHFSVSRRLAKENEALRAEVTALKAQVSQQDLLIEELQKNPHQSISSDSRHDARTAAIDALQHTLARVIPCEEERTDIVLELFRAGHVPVDEFTVVAMFELLRPELIRDAIHLIVEDHCTAQDAASVVCSALRRPDGISVAKIALEKDQVLERVLILDARSLTRRISFWELHWDELCDMLWLSSELLSTIIQKRADLAGKFLKIYSVWLGTNDAAQVMYARHRTVMEDILSQVVDFTPEFLETTLLRSRQSLRDILESPSTGEDLLETMAESSAKIVGTIIDYSQSTLAQALESRSKLLGRITAGNPSWLVRFIEENLDVTARILCNHNFLLPSLCKSSPALIDGLVRLCTKDIAFHVAGHGDSLASALAQAPDLIVEDEVFKAYPNILLTNEPRLARLGLRNLAAYQGSCTPESIQTDPIQAVNASGHARARSLMEIVGKRKARADAWTLKGLQHKIADILQEKVDADYIDDRAGHSREPLSEVVYDHFLSKEEDVTSTKRTLAGFTASVRNYSPEDSFVHWFGVLTGAVEPEKFNPQAESFFMTLLTSLVPNEDVGECVDTSSTGVTLLPLTQALDAVQNIAPMFWYDVQDREAVYDRIKELQRFSVEDSSMMGEKESNRLWAKLHSSDLEECKSKQSFIDTEELSESPTIVIPHVEINSNLDTESDEINEDNPAHSTENTKPSQSGSVGMRNIVQTKLLMPNNRLATEVLSMMHGRQSATAQAAASLKLRSFGVKVTECIALEAVINVVMKAWHAFELSEYDTLCEIFKSGDINGDGILDMDEWEVLVLVVDPQADPRTVRRMFKMTGEENEDGEHIITPNEFVEVMRAHRYTGPALAHLREKFKQKPQAP